MTTNNAEGCIHRGDDDIWNVYIFFFFSGSWRWSIVVIGTRSRNTRETWRNLSKFSISVHDLRRRSEGPAAAMSAVNRYNITDVFPNENKCVATAATAQQPADRWRLIDIGLSSTGPTWILQNDATNAVDYRNENKNTRGHDRDGNIGGEKKEKKKVRRIGWAIAYACALQRLWSITIYSNVATRGNIIHISLLKRSIETRISYGIAQYIEVGNMFGVINERRRRRPKLARTINSAMRRWFSSVGRAIRSLQHGWRLPEQQVLPYDPHQWLVLVVGSRGFV